MSETVSIVWFRRDLRLADNPALAKAVELGGVIIPVYIFAPEEEKEWRQGAASNWWLHHSLKALAAELEKIGSQLTILRGASLKNLLDLAEQCAATHIFWNRLYEPAILERDAEVKQKLREGNISAHSFNGALLKEPWTFSNQSGKPFQVYTPFWRALVKAMDEPVTLKAPVILKGPKQLPVSLTVEELNLLPRIPWDQEFYEMWKPGEKMAQEELKAFVRSGLADYKTGRDIPSKRGTSRLSPRLHFGELSPKQVWSAVIDAQKSSNADTSPEGVETYLKEIVWREFAHHLLFHFPFTPDAPLRENFKKFPWSNNEKHLRAWQRGMTGYPIVDAGMRELWHTGWMHNRVRMIVGSFLVKHLLHSWHDGAKWFWDTLVDASLASNTLGWQWIGGCGADAAPYFRIFNPMLQGEKFDPKGEYVRRWVPEIGALPDKFIHKPWEAPESLLSSLNISLGKTYPKPVVDHEVARGQALRALESVKR